MFLFQDSKDDPVDSDAEDEGEDSDAEDAEGDDGEAKPDTIEEVTDKDDIKDAHVSSLFL